MARVAARIKRLRKIRGWTARELAEKCAHAGPGSLTRNAVSKIECGIRLSISAEELAVLSTVLGVSMEALVAAPKFAIPEFEGVLSATVSNLRYYSPRNGISDPIEAHRRLVELLADAVQAIAADMTNADAETPDLAVGTIVAKLRERATKLSPNSSRRYTPSRDHSPRRT